MKDILSYVLNEYCPHFCTEKRDIYLAFKALNVSETGILTEEEFMDVYSVTKLKWKVSYHKIGVNMI